MKVRKCLVIFFDVFLLVALFWIVRYWHSRQFGLYEDDLTIIPSVLQMTFRQVVQYVFSYIAQFQGQGRPLHHSFIYLFSWLGWNLAGLWGAYLIGYSITIINIGLFYGLMRRTVGRSFALVAGFCYVLFSADTTQAYLTLSLGMQPSITFLLLAFHCYLSKKRLLAYILAFLILLGYETPFLVFIVAPLLEKDWNKPLVKKLLLHILVVGLLLILIYTIRVILNGSGGVVDLTPFQMIKYAVEHMVEGPVVSLWTYVYRPIQTIKSLNLETGLAILFAFFVFSWIFYRLDLPLRVKARDLWHTFNDPASWSALPYDIKSSLHLFLAGLAMLVLAYPITFTLSGFELTGRSTRVHSAGVVGAAIMLASVIFMFIYLANAHNVLRQSVNIVIALELALMVGYGFVIQRDYVLAWQYQKEFWTELLPLIPDANNGTVVLVDPKALQDTSQIGANTWNLPRILYQLYEIPASIKKIPAVNRLAAGWESTLVVDGRFQVNSTTVSSAPDNYGTYDSESIIIIQAENGHLVRRTTITLDGIEYTLKPETQPFLSALHHGFLYNLMINQP